MYGKTVKTLKVYVEGNHFTDSKKLKIWTKSGNQGPVWLWANVSIDAYTDLKVINGLVCFPEFVFQKI